MLNDLVLHVECNNMTVFLCQVCEEQHCEDQVFPLAVNFLDRFLCSCGITRRQLQLVAAVCLLLASKIRQFNSLSVELLCFYSDHSLTPDDIKVRRCLLYPICSQIISLHNTVQ
jgi:hypothetical protein